RCEELAAGSIGGRAQAERLTEPPEADPDGGVVVDNRDGGAARGAHRPLGAASNGRAMGCGGGRGGRRQRKVAPPPVLFSAQRRPPCAATIVCEIESPRPRPSGLVVTNGSNRRSISSGGMPVPQSRTAKHTLPAASAPTARTSRRSDA